MIVENTGQISPAQASLLGDLGQQETSGSDQPTWNPSLHGRSFSGSGESFCFRANEQTRGVIGRESRAPPPPPPFFLFYFLSSSFFFNSVG